VDNFFTQISAPASGVPSSGHTMLGILMANREMENGDSEPADPDQQDASRQLPDRFTNAQRQRCNEDASNGNYKQRSDSSSDEERQLLCSLIFFLHNDFSTHIFACPPRQQVPELVMRSNGLCSIE